jgi:predicted PhzF superfamily epimerase YddE/YHI9
LLRSGPVSADDLDRVLAVLRIERDDVIASEWLDNGPGWVGVLLASAEAVLAVDPVLPAGWRSGTLSIGLAGAYPPGSPCAYEVRAIFNDDRGRLVEDPVTGSLNASLGQWLVGSGRAPSAYVASQGSLLGRSGRAHVSRDDSGGIWVGGETHTIVDGFVDLG